MATLGTTKLEAVNQCLRAIGLDPVAAVDTGGTSDAGEAEEILDRTDEEIQSLGWPENTTKAKAHTPVGDHASTSAFVDGSHVASTRVLTKASAFPSAIEDGTEIYIAGGTLVLEGYYVMGSVSHDNSATLNHQLAIGNQTDVEVAGIGNLIVTVASSVLWIRGAGPDQHRNLVLSGDTVYDADRDTTRLLTDDTVYLDVVTLKSFIDLSQKLKSFIVARASRILRQRKMPDPMHDSFLAEQEGFLDRIADRNVFNQERDVPPNTRPIFPLRSPNEANRDGQ